LHFKLSFCTLNFEFLIQHMPSRKYIIYSFAVLISLIAKSAFAVCPVCTVAVGAGLGLAEYFGIDDSISGLWIGALIVSMSIWTINWLNKKLSFEESRLSREAGGKSLALTKKPGFGEKIRDIFIFLIYYGIVILPLYWKGKIGHPLNRLCGIDKLLFGIILGSALFAAGVFFHNYIRKRNNNVSYFKGQKIAFPVGFLLIASIILYFTC